MCRIHSPEMSHLAVVSIDILSRLAKLRFSRHLRLLISKQFQARTGPLSQRRRKSQMATVPKPAPQPIPRIAPREDLNPYRIAQIQFDLAAEYLKLDPGVRQILRSPKRVLEVSIPTKMDNGQIKVFTGYRVQHNVARGPAKGGIRYHPNVTAGRSKSPGHLDDLEDRDRQYSVWRRQGRSHLRSQADEQARTRAHDAPLRLGNPAA